MLKRYWKDLRFSLRSCFFTTLFAACLLSLYRYKLQFISERRNALANASYTLIRGQPKW